MKTSLRLIIILLVASAVSGAFFLVINSGTTSSSGSGQLLAMTSADGQTMSVLERPDGGEHDSASIAGSISGVMATLAKLSAIIVLLLLPEKGIAQFNTRKWKLAMG